MKKVSVIVSRCVKNTPPGEGRIYGDRIVDTGFDTVSEALEEGKFQCGDGRSVVVRPNYNESDADGTFYREWRSFNGEQLKEVRFPYTGQKAG